MVTQEGFVNTEQTEAGGGGGVEPPCEMVLTLGLKGLIRASTIATEPLYRDVCIC